MEQTGLAAGLTPDDIEVDDLGRVVISNPEIAAQLKATVKKPVTEGSNGNCHGTCNTVAGCGVKK